MAGCYVRGDEPSGSTKCGEVLYVLTQMIECELDHSVLY